MEVSFGVLSIYNSETKETALQRDHVALCDIQHDITNGQRSHSFVLKKPGRHPIYFAVDNEHGEYQKGDQLLYFIPGVPFMT